MGKFFVRSKETTGPEDWQVGLEKPAHWRTGRSAKALAYSWEQARGFPPEVLVAPNSSGFPTFKDIHFVRGDVEFETALPGSRRGSQSDILVQAISDSSVITMAIEGKVEEGFDKSIGNWRLDATHRSGKPDRLNFLKKRLGLPGQDLRHIRYQLLHRTASALIEAERFGASAAVMLVHSFSQCDKHLEDYLAFVDLFETTGNVDTVSHAGNRNGIDLYLAWVRGEERFLHI